MYSNTESDIDGRNGQRGGERAHEIKRKVFEQTDY